MIIAQLDGRITSTVGCDNFQLRKEFLDEKTGETIKSTARFRITETDTGIQISAINGTLTVSPKASNSINISILQD